jgi:MSHA biogenesis protein MshP
VSPPRLTRRIIKNQRGFSLVVVLFLIVVVAALGTFAVKIGASQQQTVVLGLQTARASAAANSGLEWARAQINTVAVPNCNPLPFGAGLAGMNGFQVTVSCVHVPGHTDSSIFDEYVITSKASSGTFGTPDYVSRTTTLSCIQGKNC